MKDERTTKQHESYGLVGFHRVSGNFDNLFGTNVASSTAIYLTIKRCQVDRYLNRDWYHDRGELIEVVLSPNQFAELLTTMNTANGVPCTIKHINMKRMEAPPVEPSDVQKVKTEFEDKMKELNQYMKEYSSKIEEVLAKKSILKDDKELIKGHLFKLHQEVRANLPFVLESFHESTEELVKDAKATVESFILNAVTSAGIKAIKDNGGIVSLPTLEDKREND